MTKTEDRRKCACTECDCENTLDPEEDLVCDECAYEGSWYHRKGDEDE